MSKNYIAGYLETPGIDRNHVMIENIALYQSRYPLNTHLQPRKMTKELQICTAETQWGERTTCGV